MSSEAAQKAYPDLVRGDDERYDDFEVRETIMAYSRKAFDRGAVEALRQAAAMIGGWSLSGRAGKAQYDLLELFEEQILAMADEWEVGQ